MVNCRDNYTAGPVVIIDGQLLIFRGKCRFRMFIPSKPAKYGLKIFMVCDSESSYCLNASPYLGKDELTVREVPKGGCKTQYYTMKLLTEGGLVQPGRTACCDNW